MRLKEILNEESEIKEARFLDKALEGFRRDIETPLYRGTSTEVGTEGNHFADNYDVRSIRKDRKPRDTDVRVHVLIGFLEDLKNFRPKRSESKYAATDPVHVEQYGSYIYRVFPDKTSVVRSMPFDPTNEFFGNIGSSILLANEQKDEIPEKFSTMKRFLEFTSSLYDSFSKEEYLSFLKNNWKEVRREMVQFVKNQSSMIGGVQNFIREIVQNIDGYFDSLDKGIDEFGSDEVIFDGERYLRVEPDFFEKYFIWDGGKWKLKDEVK